MFAQWLVNFHFLRAEALYLLIVPVLLYLALLLPKVARKSGWSMPEHLQKALLLDKKQDSWWGPLNAGLLVMLLLVLMLAGPSFSKQTTPFSQDAYDLVIMLSLSESMAQQDIQPSRLGRAKQKIHDLLELRKGGRVAVIVWAGSAHRVVPFTADRDIVWNFLLALDTGSMPVIGDNIGSTVPLLDGLLAEQEDQASRTGVLIVSDGFSVEQPLLDYLSGKPEIDVQLYGIGSTRQSDDVKPMNEVLLKQFASQVHGSYQVVTIDKSDIKTLASAMEQQQREIRNKDDRPWQDDGYYLLFPLMLLCLLWFRKGWALQWSIVLPFILPILLLVLASGFASTSVYANDEIADGKLDGELEGEIEGEIDGEIDGEMTKSHPQGFNFIDLWLTPDQKGQWYFKRGDYQKAAIAYQDPWRKALACYYAGQFSDTVKQLQNNSSGQALFLKGNALAHQGAYVAARLEFAKLLGAEPDNAAAKQNFTIVDKIIREADEFTESQQEESSEGSRDLGDNPQSSEGAESKMGQAAQSMSLQADEDDSSGQSSPMAKRKQMSAEQILQDEQLQQTWMKQVSQDPSTFLRLKFQAQTLKTETTAGEVNDE